MEHEANRWLSRIWNTADFFNRKLPEIKNCIRDFHISIQDMKISELKTEFIDQLNSTIDMLDVTTKKLHNYKAILDYIQSYLQRASRLTRVDTLEEDINNEYA